jgi:hypothetical protein
MRTLTPEAGACIRPCACWFAAPCAVVAPPDDRCGRFCSRRTLVLVARCSVLRRVCVVFRLTLDALLDLCLVLNVFNERFCALFAITHSPECRCRRANGSLSPRYFLSLKLTALRPEKAFALEPASPVRNWRMCSSSSSSSMALCVRMMWRKTFSLVSIMMVQPERYLKSPFSFGRNCLRSLSAAS